MSGRKIDDHSFWAGKAGKDMVMPQGVHTKGERSADSAGKLGKYEDTTEEIRDAQEMAERKAKGHDRKPLHRN